MTRDTIIDEFFLLSGAGGTLETPIPLTVGTPLVWLDGADTSTQTLDGSDNVEQWRDRSGNARHANPPGVLSRPGVSTVNGLRGIQFDTVDDLLEGSVLFTANTAFTMFAVVRKDANSTDERVAYFIAGTDKFYGLSVASNGASANGRAGYLNGNVAWQPEGGSDLTNGTVILQQLSRTPNATAYLRYPGAVSQGPSDAPTAAPYGVYRIGWQGGAGTARQQTTVCEILVYDTDLSAGDKTIIRAYLGAKWGVTV